jgi:Uma2 family endonuclease
MRRPDLCYLSPQQIYEASEGGHPVPQFVVEVISPTDTADYYDTKLDHYYAAGVKVVWFIYPKTGKAVVYGPDRSSVTLQGSGLCSAAPVLPAFEMTAAEIFKKPAKPEGV